MGLPDDYTLPANYIEAYDLMGDGVVALVVRFLARHVLEPLVNVKTSHYRLPTRREAQPALQS
jgi:hypothetical protein